MAKVAFLGLGVMGFPMAGHLAAKGHDYMHDRSRMFHFGPNGLFAPGALPAASWGK